MVANVFLSFHIRNANNPYYIKLFVKLFLQISYSKKSLTNMTSPLWCWKSGWLRAGQWRDIGRWRSRGSRTRRERQKWPGAQNLMIWQLVGNTNFTYYANFRMFVYRAHSQKGCRPFGKNSQKILFFFFWWTKHYVLWQFQSRDDKREQILPGKYPPAYIQFPKEKVVYSICTTEPWA